MGSVKYIEKSKGEWKFGKVSASLDEALKDVQWGEYKLEEIFERVKCKRLNYKVSELPTHPTKGFDLPALTAGIQNQGLNSYVPRAGADILKDVISISANGANTGATFYQNKEFTVLQDAYAIDLINKNKISVSKNAMLFLTGAIQKAIYGNYEWTNKAGWNRIKDNIIQLPIKNEEIDFKFMESFVAELETQQFAELKAYLTVTGLKDYTLTDAEQKSIKDFDNKAWQSSKLKELFYVESYKKRFDANKVQIKDSGHPYIVRTALNNGLKGYLNENPKYLNEGNTISFGQDTATMFYQKKPYFTGDKIKILKFKHENFNENKALFLITAMSKSFSAFRWGSSSFSEEVIEGQEINLPRNDDGAIDYEYINNFISALKKLLIRDVVKWIYKV